MCSLDFVVVTGDGVPNSAATKPADTDKSIPNTGEFSKHLFCLVGGFRVHVWNCVTELNHTDARQTTIFSPITPLPFVLSTPSLPLTS